MRHTHVQSVLPKLRRHAFVLAGDRDEADELVLKCLEDYKAAPGQVRPISAKLDLFRLFHAALRRPTLRPVNPTYPKGEAALPTDDSRAQAASLNGLTADQRSVLTLVAVEGFDYAECADVLDLPVDEVAALLRQARRTVTVKSQRRLAACP